MKKILIPFFLLSLFGSIAKADFGDAAFPVELFSEGPKSYHDAWCRKIKNKCRVRFQGPAMWVEGQGGIQRDQFIGFRYDEDGSSWGSMEYYNYISYRAGDGTEREALFLFSHFNAQRDFIRALNRWRRQEPKPIPNYRFPASQGPQDTQGRDKGNNPYDNQPIKDWSEKTTKE